jgi:ubiquinone/menaquinone biosynthesis C-methylase UbiE
MGTVYETDLLIKAHHGSMHPGGLRLTDRAVRLAGLTEGMHVADIGCGTGATAAFLKEKYRFSMVGLDSSDTLVAYGLKNHPGLNLIRWDGRTLPFEDGSLDALLFECTLSIIGNTRQTLAQAAKALKDAGIVIISDVYPKRCKRCISTGEAHPPTAAELAGTLADTGYKIVVQEDHTAALRTYAAELWEKNEGGLDVCSFFGLSCQSEGVRLSGLEYILTIARKI